MKSSYELAMERLNKASPTVKLTAAQKKNLAELDSIYAAKIAERELALKSDIDKSAATSPGTSEIGTSLVTSSSAWSHSSGCTHRQFSTITVWQMLLMIAGFAHTLPITRAFVPSYPVSSRSSRWPLASGDTSLASV